MNLPVLFPTTWKDYELIDTGDGAKLERFGTYIINRPDPRVLWKKSAPEAVWKYAHASYIRSNKDEGHWNIVKQEPSDWSVSYEDLVFTLKPTTFKHVGIFTEQAVNWDWMRKVIGRNNPKILNLFGYTGGATLAAASAGALVTHVDSSKPTITWARENAVASKLSNKPVRWIVEDAYKFVLREVRRGSIYDAIIMDPPRFGRGSKGEVWKIEEDLPKLLATCKELLTPNPLFVLVNAYTADLSPIVLRNLLVDFVLARGEVRAGELALKDTFGKLLPSGIFATYTRP